MLGIGQEEGKDTVLRGGDRRPGRLALLQQGLFGPCANGHDFRGVAGECFGVTEAGDSRGTAGEASRNRGVWKMAPAELLQCRRITNNQASPGARVLLNHYPRMEQRLQRLEE